MLVEGRCSKDPEIRADHILGPRKMEDRKLGRPKGPEVGFGELS